MNGRVVFLGSFNPIHDGHLDVIDYLINDGYLDIDLIVSPHNPQKDINSLLPFDLRVEICNAAISDDFGGMDGIPNYEGRTQKWSHINVNTIEENLSPPYYTYKTLRKLTEEYNEKPIILVLGSDVIDNLDTWENFEEISKYPIIEMTRPIPFSDIDIMEVNSIIREKLNIITILDIWNDMSSTIIREKMEKGEVDFVKKNMTPTSFKIYNRHCNIKKIIG
tara:strand:- start:42968 stop:43630 length:663 start_codon:yes stop_codon:yes gene_type:complete